MYLSRTTYHGPCSLCESATGDNDKNRHYIGVPGGVPSDNHFSNPGPRSTGPKLRTRTGKNPFHERERLSQKGRRFTQVIVEDGGPRNYS